MNLIKICFIISIFFVGCKDDTENTEINFDIYNWESKSKIPYNAIKSIDFIPLETREDILLSNISKVVITDDRIFILDSPTNLKVFVFSKDGKYLYSYGNFGKGPGEMISLTDFIVDEQNNFLYTLDPNARKVLKFDLQTTKFISNIKIPFSAVEFEKLDDTHFVFGIVHNFKVKNEHAIVIMDMINNSYKWHNKIDDYYASIRSPYQITQSGGTFFVPYFKNIIYKIDKDDVYPYIKFNLGEYKVQSSLIKKSRNNKIASRELLDNCNNCIYAINNVLENELFMTFNINFKGSYYNVVYSKTTKLFLYGKGYETCFSYINNLTVNNNEFISAIYADAFLSYSKKVFINHKDSVFKTKYFNTIKSINISSNPILLKIEYNIF